MSFVCFRKIEMFMGKNRLEITTDQDAVQIYSSWGMNSTGRKVAHGGAKINYGRYSGVAIEQQNLIDAINTPEWGVNQICEFLGTKAEQNGSENG